VFHGLFLSFIHMLALRVLLPHFPGGYWEAGEGPHDSLRIPPGRGKFEEKKAF
jgi:hypothetical protein